MAWRVRTWNGISIYRRENNSMSDTRVCRFFCSKCNVFFSSFFLFFFFIFLFQQVHVLQIVLYFGLCCTCILLPRAPWPLESLYRPTCWMLSMWRSRCNRSKMWSLTSSSRLQAIPLFEAYRLGTSILGMILPWDTITNLNLCCDRDLKVACVLGQHANHYINAYFHLW